MELLAGEDRSQLRKPPQVRVETSLQHCTEGVVGDQITLGLDLGHVLARLEEIESLRMLYKPNGVVVIASKHRYEVTVWTELLLEKLHISVIWFAPIRWKYLAKFRMGLAYIDQYEATMLRRQRIPKR